VVALLKPQKNHRFVAYVKYCFITTAPVAFYFYELCLFTFIFVVFYYVEITCLQCPGNKFQ